MYIYWHWVNIVSAYGIWNISTVHSAIAGFPDTTVVGPKFWTTLDGGTTLLPPGQRGQSRQERASTQKWYDEMMCICVIISASLIFVLAYIIHTACIFYTTPNFWCQLDCIWMCIYITCVLRIGVTPIFSRSRDSQQSTASAKAARTSAWRRIGRKAKFGEGWNFFSNECFFFGGFWRGVCMKLHFCDFLDVYFLDSFFEKSLSLFLSTGIEIWNL